MGRENISEIELRVISRVAEEASTPAYQALTTVLSRPKARMAMVIPRIVNRVLRRWRNAFRERILR
jgi:hypothetical protein